MEQANLDDLVCSRCGAVVARMPLPRQLWWSACRQSQSSPLSEEPLPVRNVLAALKVQILAAFIRGTYLRLRRWCCYKLVHHTAQGSSSRAPAPRRRSLYLSVWQGFRRLVREKGNWRGKVDGEVPYNFIGNKISCDSSSQRLFHSPHALSFLSNLLLYLCLQCWCWRHHV